MRTENRTATTLPDLNDIARPEDKTTAKKTGFFTVLSEKIKNFSITKCIEKIKNFRFGEAKAKTFVAEKLPQETALFRPMASRAASASNTFIPHVSTTQIPDREATFNIELNVKFEDLDKQSNPSPWLLNVPQATAQATSVESKSVNQAQAAVTFSEEDFSAMGKNLSTELKKNADDILGVRGEPTGQKNVIYMLAYLSNGALTQGSESELALPIEERLIEHMDKRCKEMMGVNFSKSAQLRNREAMKVILTDHLLSKLPEAVANKFREWMALPDRAERNLEDFLAEVNTSKFNAPSEVLGAKLVNQLHDLVDQSYSVGMNSKACNLQSIFYAVAELSNLSKWTEIFVGFSEQEHSILDQLNISALAAYRGVMQVTSGRPPREHTALMRQTMVSHLLKKVAPEFANKFRELERSNNEARMRKFLAVMLNPNATAVDFNRINMI